MEDRKYSKDDYQNYMKEVDKLAKSPNLSKDAQKSFKILRKYSYEEWVKYKRFVDTVASESNN